MATRQSRQQPSQSELDSANRFVKQLLLPLEATVASKQTGLVPASTGNAISQRREQGAVSSGFASLAAVRTKSMAEVAPAFEVATCKMGDLLNMGMLYLTAWRHIPNAGINPEEGFYQFHCETEFGGEQIVETGGAANNSQRRAFAEHFQHNTQPIGPLVLRTKNLGRSGQSDLFIFEDAAIDGM